MDNNLPPTQPQQQTQSIFQTLVQFFKTHKKILLIIISGSFILVIFLGFFMIRSVSNNSTKDSQNNNITFATVGDKPVYKDYLEKELAFYPGTKSAEIKRDLEEKIIDDQVTLLAGKKEGLITDFPDSPTLSNEQYIERSKQVTEIKNKIHARVGGTITVEVVSIWFENQMPASIGYEQAKTIAYTKISRLYERVKNKQISIREAGQLIATDTELEKQDRAYRENAYTKMTAKRNEEMTFWPEFDAMLWDLPVGGITTIYTGTDQNWQKTAVIPILYTFGQVVEKKADNNEKDFTQWLADKKKEFTVQYE